MTGGEKALLTGLGPGHLLRRVPHTNLFGVRVLVCECFSDVEEGLGLLRSGRSTEAVFTVRSGGDGELFRQNLLAHQRSAGPGGLLLRMLEMSMSKGQSSRGKKD